jgi:hypothetical protein
MKTTNVFLRIVFCVLLCALSAAVAAGDASPEGHETKPRALSMWAACGVVLDVASYGLEKWSPGIFVKVSVPVAEALEISARPCFLYENRAFSLRAAVTLDLIPCMGKGEKTDNSQGADNSGRAETRPVDPRPYLGGGLAWYKDDSYLVNPMVSGGLDIGFSERFVLMMGGNLLLEHGDTDLEILGAFGINIR